MSCNLQKFNRYPVSQIIKDNGTGRILVKLGVDIPSCPDGVLNNSHTKIVEDSNAQVSVLTFDDKAGVPVVFRSLSTPITYLDGGQASVGVNAGESMNTGIGFFGYAAIALAFVAMYLVIKKLFFSQQYATQRGYDSYSRDYTGYSGSPRVGGGGTTIVNNNNGGGSSFLEGAVVGGVLGYEAGKSSTPSEAPAKKDDSYSSDSSSSFGSDSSSSFGSDSSSSYSSDSGSSSFGSDSSSSFGSDSGSSFGSDN